MREKDCYKYTYIKETERQRDREKRDPISGVGIDTSMRSKREMLPGLVLSTWISVPSEALLQGPLEEW